MNRSPSYWLLKSEPDVFSFADLKARPRRREPWDGVRNYQARNFMRDEMRAGDLGLFYHSNCKPPGVAGVLEIVREAYTDPTQFDPLSDYHDPKSDPDNPRWLMVDVGWHADFERFVPLDTLRASKGLEQMRILQRGNRLSITPLTKREFDLVCKLGGVKR